MAKSGLRGCSGCSVSGEVRDDLRRYILEHFAVSDVNCLPSMSRVRARLSELRVWATLLRVLHISFLIGSFTMHYVLPELNDCTC